MLTYSEYLGITSSENNEEQKCRKKGTEYILEEYGNENVFYVDLKQKTICELDIPEKYDLTNYEEEYKKIRESEQKYFNPKDETESAKRLTNISLTKTENIKVIENSKVENSKRLI